MTLLDAIEHETAEAPAHRCNGVNGAEHHGTQNKCTVCGEYREGWHDSFGMEVRAQTMNKTSDFKKGDEAG